MGKEIHAISCASKPLSSWTTQHVIQECREACGGNGYLKGYLKYPHRFLTQNFFIFIRILTFLNLAARLGDLRNSNDPFLTFEGDNNVLLQQTSNHLLSAFDEFVKTKIVPETPLQTMDYLKRFDSILKLKFDDSIAKPNLLNPTSNLKNQIYWII